MSSLPPPSTPAGASPPRPRGWFGLPWWKQALIVVGVGGVALWIGAANVKEDDPPAPASYTLVYRFTGTSCGDVTMATPSGIRQVDPACPGDTWTFRAGPDDRAYVSVQNGTERGTVGCEIVLDGRTVASEKSSGAYVIATCSP